ncbi:MAG: RdgB/HAM1 family non-canonical purine NTP pyrophosphatase [Pseudomonadota bacterium]
MFDTLLLATHNRGKVDEFQTMLAPIGIELKSAHDFDLPEPEETESTFTGNALLKARHAVQKTGLPSLADDSGLSIDALDGAPGIHSARWAVNEAGERDFSMAMEKVNQEIGDIDGTQTAYFTAVLALVFPDGREEIFEGRVDGTLCWPARGDKGFGYDPIFIPQGHDITFGEMGADFKHKISHRALAVEKFEAYLKSHG